MAAPKGTRIPNAPRGRVGPNKLTRSVKEAFEHVFKDLQADPKQPHHLAEWAKQQPTEFYKLAAKLIPTEIKGQLEHKVTPKVDVLIGQMTGKEKPEGQ